MENWVAFFRQAPLEKRRRGEEQVASHDPDTGTDDTDQVGQCHPSHSENSFKAGSLSLSLSEWQKLTHDKHILDIISGLKIDFMKNPTQINEPKQIQFNPQEKEIVNSEIENLKRLGVIEHTEEVDGQFISNIFIRKKKNNSYRLILNLKELNQFIEYHHFKMENFNTVLHMLKANMYMASVDLTHAYYSVNVHKSHRKYLRFRWNGHLYQFTCMPNGLACAPRIFTKILKPVFSHLRLKGNQCNGYIDDTYAQAETKNECMESVNMMAALFKSLGFEINFEKSCFEPSKKIKFLGFIVDSETMHIKLPEEKALRMIKICRSIQKSKTQLIRDVACLLGLIVSSFPAVKYGPLLYRCLEIEKTKALKQNRGDFDARMCLSYESKEEISWWNDNILGSMKSICLSQNPEFVVRTDASLQGWGAFLDSSVGGRWAVEEKNCHINVLEIKAILS